MQTKTRCRSKATDGEPVQSRQADGWSNLVKGRSSDLWKGTLGKYAGRAKAESVINSIEMREYCKHNYKNFGWETNISRQVFPQAPSPTMTSLRRISAILMAKSVRDLRLSGINQSNCDVGWSSVACRDDVGCTEEDVVDEDRRRFSFGETKSEERKAVIYLLDTDIVTAFRNSSLFTDCLQAF